MNYYNENDVKAAAWLQALIEAKLLPSGHVDTRSIVEVKPSDLAGYTQCHFFAGIGGWSLALQLAEWATTRSVWSGSCPCQPFSVAGKGKGKDDERHLWPEFARLIRECRPDVVFGEQVASRAGREWLAGVQADLEEMGFAVGAVDLCAAGVSAPHIRQRLFWVADAGKAGCPGSWPREPGCGNGNAPQGHQSGGCNSDGWMANPHRTGSEGSNWSGFAGGPESKGARPVDTGGSGHWSRSHWKSCSDGGLANTPDGGQRTDRGAPRSGGYAKQREQAGGPWLRSYWKSCSDGKARRVAEPELQPVVDGLSPLLDALREFGLDAGAYCDSWPLADKTKIQRTRAGLLKGYGNAIVPQVAAEFIKAFMEVRCAS